MPKAGGDGPLVESLGGMQETAGVGGIRVSRVTSLTQLLSGQQAHASSRCTLVSTSQGASVRASMVPPFPRRVMGKARIDRARAHASASGW